MIDSIITYLVGNFGQLGGALVGIVLLLIAIKFSVAILFLTVAGFFYLIGGIFMLLSYLSPSSDR